MAKINSKIINLAIFSPQWYVEGWWNGFVELGWGLWMSSWSRTANQRWRAWSNRGAHDSSQPIGSSVLCQSLYFWYSSIVLSDVGYFFVAPRIAAKFVFKDGGQPMRGRWVSFPEVLRPTRTVLTKHYSTRFERNDLGPKLHQLGFLSRIAATGVWELLAEKKLSNAEHIVERLMRPSFALPRFPLVFELQETTLWISINWRCPDLQFFWSTGGTTTFQFSFQCNQILVHRSELYSFAHQGPWRLSTSTLPILQGRKEGDTFFMATGLNVELGSWSTEDDEQTETGRDAQKITVLLFSDGVQQQSSMYWVEV